MTDFEVARHNMVESQVRTSDVTDRRLIEAIEHVERHAFVASPLKSLAYMDEDVPVSTGGDSRRLMRPMFFARLLQEAETGPDDLVLVVGGGTGYAAAVFAQLAESVVALEADESLSENASQILMDLQIDNVAFVNGPLAAGYPSEGPYDVIFLDGAVPEVPDSLLRQLKDGGRLVAVVGNGPVGKATVFVHARGVTGSNVKFDAAVPVLPGFEKEAEFSF